MAKSLKEKVERTGQKVAEAASKAGHKVAEKMEEAADTIKEKAHQAGHRMSEAVEKMEHRSAKPLAESTGPMGSVADIKHHQDVYASCGTWVGKVDHVEGKNIKLTKNDSPDGRHHLIPMSWVAKVHDHIHLDRDHVEVQRGWEPA